VVDGRSFLVQTYFSAKINHGPAYITSRLDGRWYAVGGVEGAVAMITYFFCDAWLSKSCSLMSLPLPAKNG
jgi:hypothetical protein